MRKATKNYILFITLLLLGLFQAISGFVLWAALPQGGGGRGSGIITFWSLTRQTWIDIHDWVAVALVVMIIIHLILHRKWIVYMTKSYFR